MNPVHIAPLTALSTVRRINGPLTRRSRLARRALLPLCMGSCALPLVSAHAQTAPASTSATARAKATAAHTSPIVLAPTTTAAFIATIPDAKSDAPVRAINRALTSKPASAVAGATPVASGTPPINSAAVDGATINTSARIAINTSARTNSAAPVATSAASTLTASAPIALEAPRVVAWASMPPVALDAPVRLAQLRPKDTEAPATPRETGPQVLEVPVGPEVPITKEPQAPPPDTGVTAPRVPPALNGGVLDVSPDQPAIIGDVRGAEGREISDVRVVGSRVVPADTILAQVRLQRGAAFSSRQAEIDLQRISQLGFFAAVQAQVAPDLSDPNKTVLTYIVVENRVITGFEFVNNTAVKAETIIPILTSKVGTVLNLNSVRADVTAIENLYKDKGFAALINSGGVNQNESGVLIFQIGEATISQINVIGLKKTKESLVRRQIRIKPGDTFDATKMRQDLNRLYDTNFFDAVEPRIDDNANEPGTVTVNFVFREKRTGQFQVGVGFDTRSKLSGFVTLSESNLRGSGQRGFASIETGAQRNFELGTGNPFIGDKNSSYDVSIYRRSLFRQPNSLVRLITGNTNATATSDTTITLDNGTVVTIPANSTLQEQRTGGRINFTKPLDYDRRRTLIFGYRNENANARITNFNQGSLTNEQIAAQAQLDPLLARGNVSALSLGFLRDSRDLRIDPSSGGRESLVAEQAFKLLGGNVSFTKLDLDLRRYFPIIRGEKIGTPAKLVAAGRVVLGRSIGQLPIFEQYYVGGTETVRGYNTEQQFGDNQLYGNFELRYRFQNRVTGVLFADTGTAYGGNFATSNDINLLSSVGIGVRLVTPIGPIRLDYGFGRDGGRTHFGIGSTF